MEFGIEKYSFMLILCAYQAFKVIKNGVNIPNILKNTTFFNILYFSWSSF